MLYKGRLILMCKITINILVLDTVDDETTKEVMRRVKALSLDEVVKQTKWLNLSELDLALQYHYGILLIDNVRVIITMDKIVKCVNEGDKNE